MRWRLWGTVAYADNVRRPWQVVPSLSQLLVQVDAAYPIRHAADGTAAGQGHFNTNPKSDHTPDINGDVRAGDIGEVVENDAFNVAESIRLSKDSRIKYVIHERRIFSSYNHSAGAPFTWRPYSGSNPHSSHVHVSVLRSNQANKSPWDIGNGESPTAPLPEEDDMELIKAHQTALNEGGFVGANGLRLVVDGLLGPNTQHALNSQAKAAASDTTGLSQDQSDDRYVRKGQPVSIKGLA